MSTDIATIPDALRPESDALEVYAGTGGICLFAHGPHDHGYKIWLDAAGLDALEAAIQIARSHLP
jgi:hypothetical protein